MLRFLQQLWRNFRSAMQNKKLRRYFYVAIVLLSIVFIALAIKNNWAELRHQQWHLEPIYIILLVLLYPIGMFPTVAGWHWILRAFQIKKPFTLNLRLYALSTLPKHIPGLVWYITSRTLLYEENNVDAGIIIGATATETALLALSGFITAILIFSFRSDLPSQFKILRVLSPISIIGLILLFLWAPGGSRLLDRLLKRWRKDYQAIKLQRPALFVSMVWMFLAWFGGGILLWLLTRSFTPIGIAYLPLMAGIWGAAGAVSLTIGIGIQGLGLREVTLGAILSLIISPITAIVVAIAFRLAITVAEFLWVFLISITIKDSSKTTDVYLSNNKDGENRSREQEPP